MVSLYEQQTDDEREGSTGSVNKNNRRGFATKTVARGTYFARWVLGDRRLSGKFIDEAREIAMFHAAQLTRIANERMENPPPTLPSPPRPPGTSGTSEAPIPDSPRFIRKKGRVVGTEPINKLGLPPYCEDVPL